MEDYQLTFENSSRVDVARRKLMLEHFSDMFRKGGEFPDEVDFRDYRIGNVLVRSRVSPKREIILHTHSEEYREEVDNLAKDLGLAA